MNPTYRNRECPTAGRARLFRSASFVRKAALGLCLGLSPAVLAAEPAPSTRVDALALSIQRVTLDNGLRVVLNVDPGAPNVAVCVTYDVGSRNEEPGRTGFAHLFEHMMFQGSEHVAKGEHFKLVTARGGTLNGTTSEDRTNYFEMLPSSELPLALWLEADRMKTLAVTRENVDNQRAVVQEEYRMRVSNQAYAEGFVRLKALAYDSYFPYSHDPIGSMADLDAAKFEYVSAFHDTYYAPDNAVLSIAGAIDPDATMDLVREYFGPAKKRARHPQPILQAPPPEPTAPRHADVKDTNARTPAVLQGWIIPPYRSPQHYALELAALVLGDGESSRLYQKLVRGEGKAQDVSVWTNDHRGPDLFAVRAVLSEKAKLPDVQKTLDAEIAALAERAPTDAELARTKAKLTAEFLFGLESNLHRATELAEYELYWGDARLLAHELERYQAVTGAEVQAAVAKFLKTARRSTVHVLPPGPLADSVLGDQKKEPLECGGP